MRYSMMLQLVTGITLVFLGSAAVFAWIQNRIEPMELGQVPASPEPKQQEQPSWPGIP
jgi:succinate dehydrogenase hydrophobic anchor subunit